MDHGNKNYYVAKCNNISCNTIEGISFIYIEDKKILLQLNDVGSFVWNCVDGATTLSGIVKKCSAIYDGDGVEEGIIDFVNDLKKQKLVVFSRDKFKGVMRNA